MDRRRFLAASCAGLAALWSGGASLGAASTPDDDFLDDLQRRCFRYFQEKTDAGTGLTLDRARSDGSPYSLADRATASVTGTGFGLAGFCIAAERGWIDRASAAGRIRTALRFFADHAPHQHGWFYHWLHLRSGQRAGAYSIRGKLSEISTIDSALLLSGVLTARQYFSDDAEIVDLAERIYRRVDFPWMLQSDLPLLCHGWTPEKGFITYEWSEYSEASVLYLLGIGSQTHPIPPSSWYAWKRNRNSFGSRRFIGTAPLFIHQYSHAFVDFRHRRDDRGQGVDWFGNSVTATRAHRDFCLSLATEFPGYNQTTWGITSSMSAKGYVDWGGPPFDPRIDGTVVPCAAAGSLMFTPDICLPALRSMHERFGARIYGRYGFTDAFHPTNGWVSPDVIALNVGITLLAVENYRSGGPWRWFMTNSEPRRALDLANFRPGTMAE